MRLPDAIKLFGGNGTFIARDPTRAILTHDSRINDFIVNDNAVWRPDVPATSQKVPTHLPVAVPTPTVAPRPPIPDYVAA